MLEQSFVHHRFRIGIPLCPRVVPVGDTALVIESAVFPLLIRCEDVTDIEIETQFIGIQDREVVLEDTHGVIEPLILPEGAGQERICFRCLTIETDQFLGGNHGFVPLPQSHTYIEQFQPGVLVGRISRHLLNEQIARFFGPGYIKPVDQYPCQLIMGVRMRGIQFDGKVEFLHRVPRPTPQGIHPGDRQMSERQIVVNVGTRRHQPCGLSEEVERPPLSAPFLSE